MNLVHRIAGITCVWAVVAGSQAQVPNYKPLSDLLTGKGFVTSYKLKDLPDDFKAVALRSQSPSNSLESLLPLFMFSVSMSGGRDTEMEPSKALSLLDLCWTKGETVFTTPLESQKQTSYLIVYQSKNDMATIQAIGRNGLMDPNEIVLSLRLIEVGSIQSIMPQPEITKTKILDDFKNKKPSAGDKTKAISNAKQIAIAFIMYAADNDDIFPFVNSTVQAKNMVMPYMKNAEIWSTGYPGTEFRYNINIGGVSQTAIEDVVGTPLLFESGPRGDGSRIVAFTDGHVVSISAEEWPRVELALKKKYPRTTTKPTGTKPNMK